MGHTSGQNSDKYWRQRGKIFDGTSVDFGANRAQSRNIHRPILTLTGQTDGLHFSQKWRHMLECDWITSITSSNLISSQSHDMYVIKKRVQRQDTNHACAASHLKCVAMKFAEWFYCPTWREPCDFIIIKTSLFLLQVAPVTISTHWSYSRGSCGSDKSLCFYVSSQKWAIGF